MDSTKRLRPFVWLSLAMAVLPGFGVGAGLLVSSLANWPLAAWWPEVGQAHGHAQVFGFAGLMIFGVGLYVLPRLRGAPLVAPHLLPVVLALYGGGVVLRVLGQQVGPPLAAWSGSALVARLFAVLLALSGPGELAGASLAMALLVRTHVTRPPLRARAGLRQVLPLVAFAWLSLWVALLLNTIGTLLAAAPVYSPAASGSRPMEGAWLLPVDLDETVVHLALLGWLVPMAVALAARHFPLFLGAPPAPARRLWWGLGLLVAALLAAPLADLVASALSRPDAGDVASAVAAALTGAGLLWLTLAVGAFGPRRRFPGQFHDSEEARLAASTSTALRGAFGWLALAGLLAVADAFSPWFGYLAPPDDAERHALGAGFALLLIVGMGLRLLPGLMGRHRASRRAGVAAIALAHSAAALRVLPPLVVWLFGLAGWPGWAALSRTMAGAEVLAGVAGAGAVVFLAGAILGGPARGAPDGTLPLPRAAKPR